MQRRDLRQLTNGQPSETRAFTWSCEKWGYITKHFKWCSISNRDHFGITLLSVILNFFFWGGTQSAQSWAKFWTKLPIFSKIFLILSQFWPNLAKFWKIVPFIYQILHFIRGHSYTKRLILLPMLAAHPRRVFCTKYPPRGRSLYLTVRGTTGCPRMFYTVFQKNIRNIKSTMSLIIILVIECLICAVPTVKISFRPTWLYPWLRCDMVSLKIDEYPKCHFSAKGQFLETLQKQTGALNSSFSREKSTLAEQYLAWTTVW